MIITALVPISMLCQVVLVSILIPRNLARIARHETTAQSGQAESQQAFYRRYFFVNRVIATLGLASLWICASLYHVDAISVTTLLLSIGIVFLIQVSPLAILFYYGLLPINQTSNGIGDLESGTGVPGLFKPLFSWLRSRCSTHFAEGQAKNQWHEHGAADRAISPEISTAAA